MTSATPALANIIFPRQSQPLAQLNRSLSKRPLTIHNRLASIAHDAAFVDEVAAELCLPVIANERCGSWYVRPTLKRGSAYFKSTDGHWGVWGWSTRRLNVGVLNVVGDSGGCIIVDSTRKGKHMPDALSKTVPIWIAVMNRLLFPELRAFHSLEPFLALISQSEHDQIEARLDGFVESAKELDLDVSALRAQVRRPMRPIWICRSLNVPSEEAKAAAVDQDEYNPVYLCMASEHQNAVEYDPNAVYVQGSGDDAEGWGHGLGAELFWQNQETLLATSEEELPGLIEQLMAGRRRETSGLVAQSALPSGLVAVGPIPENAECFDESSLYILCVSHIKDAWRETLGKRLLHLRCGTGKLGSRDLRIQLPQVAEFIACHEVNGKIVILDPTGKDLAVGVALAVLCLFTDEAGTLDTHRTNQEIDKSIIRRKLGWIMTTIPDAAPSRATLNAVNAFLMKQPD